MSLSRDRIFSLLEKKIPDRLPCLELLISKQVIGKIHPGMDYNQFCVAEELDFIFVKRDFDITWMDKENGIYKNDWGVIRKVGPEETDDYLSGPIQNMEDLKRFNIPDPLSPKNFRTLSSVVKKYKKDKFIVFLSKGTFNFPWALIGNFQKYLTELYLNPDFIMSLHKMVEEHHIELNKKALGIGADAIALVDDYAYREKMFISREKFQQFCLPSIQRTCEIVHNRGGHVFFHSDGNLNEVIDLVIDSGIDFLHPIEPGAMVIKDIYNKYSDRVIICGNVNCARTLTFGTTDDVKKEVFWLLENIAPRGRYIISSSNTIHSKVKPENFIVYLETVKKYGKYPINLSTFQK